MLVLLLLRGGLVQSMTYFHVWSNFEEGDGARLWMCMQMQTPEPQVLVES